MSKIFLIPLLALVAIANGQHDWAYEASYGRFPPAEWSKKYPKCAGTRQSPIDIVDSAVKSDSSLKPIRFINYDLPLTGLTMLNDGHSIKVLVPSKYDLRISTPSLPTSYKLAQFHFHWPSEHTFNGQRFPLELHLVHANPKLTDAQTTTDQTGLVVVAILFDYRQGSYIGNTLKTMLSNTISITEENENVTLPGSLTLDDLLPQDTTSYIRYSGSLTTPVCAETVEFHILTNTMPIAQSHVSRFASLRHEYLLAANKPAEGNIDHNARPVQKLNGRTLRLLGDMGDLPSDL